ncbi:MAG TPA: hypothetical protein VIW68_12070 [Candidatus Sulfotelmatobacter sp.]
MNENVGRFVRLGVGLLSLVVLGCVLTGFAAKPAQHGIPLPTDWSHSHLIFSRPASVEQAMRLQKDPRFEQQLYRRAQALRLPFAGTDGGDLISSQLRLPLRRGGLKGLWEESLGAGATVGAVNFPAKFSFNSSVANCGGATTPDFVVYSTGLAGSGTQASIIAYDNLYVGCTGIVPSTYWAYNTGGQILTSPDFSLDGTQVMFVQATGGIGSFVLLKWKASATETVGAPGVPTSVSNASYSGCAAPCMTSIQLQDTSHVPTNDVTSSVYYDFSGDTAWVGDSRNWLHRFNPVIKGTPAEVVSSWPVQLNPGNATALASPVYDQVSGNVFVGDAGGFFYRVSASTGAVTASSQIGHGTGAGAGIVAGPIVDSTAEVAYVFASNDGVAPSAAVYRFASGFATGTAGAKAIVGTSAAAPEPLYEGALDSAYENSVNAAGNLYVCGHTSGRPFLYQVQITSGGVLGTVTTGPPIATAGTGCSPVTDILNRNATGGRTEWIFAGVQNNGRETPCGGGGCVMNFKDTPWQPLTAYSVGQEIVDSNFHVQMVITGGTSAAAAPTWSASLGAPPLDETADGGVTWVNLGLTAGTTPVAWVPGHRYAVGNFIEDTNSAIEVVTAIFGASHSGGVQPTWNTTFGQTTADSQVTWTNAGPATGALASAGGSSAIIVDNTVTSGVSGSQIYFSTQANQTCGATPNVGCAVQASQSALK